MKWPKILVKGLSMNRQVSAGAVTVLVLENEPLILDMVSEELAGEGFSVLGAGTGEAALSIVASGQIVDVLFTDIRLPGQLDGRGLATTVREAKLELPVIYTSGYAAEDGAAVPGSVFLKKPYLPAAIIETIRTLSPTLHS
jgi:CheY-like chemotaxis protein